MDSHFEQQIRNDSSIDDDMRARKNSTSHYRSPEVSNASYQ